ncbi:MAG: uroporphyrinogen-III synthase [Kangiellaceae bacterium]|nr:uroporphyrinogen-III synthase [Kangiellaceae bacterium]
MASVKHTHFIVTRPINRATNLVSALESLTSNIQPIEVSHCPLISICDYHDDDFFNSIAENTLDYDGVIFISGNAVDWAKQRLTQEQWQKLINNALYAIGEQTAKVLESEISQLGLSNQTNPANQATITSPKQMNSEGLLSLNQLKNLKGQSWLIVKGLGGRNTLRCGIESQGANISELAVYQRKLPDLASQKAIARTAADNPIWLISSIEALTNLSRILNRSVQYCRIIVSSDRIAVEANKLGFNLVAQAQDATDHQLTKIVEQLIR